MLNQTKSCYTSSWWGRIILILACCLFTADPALCQTVAIPLQQVRGTASDIAISPDGVVYVLDSEGVPWVLRLGQGQKWAQLPGAFHAIRAGLDGSVWAITQDNLPYQLAGTWWREAPLGHLRDMAAMPDGTLVTLNVEGVLETRTASGQVLSKVEGDFKAYDHLLVDEHGLPWFWNTSGTMKRYNGTSWVELDSFAVTGIASVSAGMDGSILLVDGKGKVQRWNHAAGQWGSEPMPQPMKLVAVGPNGKPWFVAPDGVLFASEVFSDKSEITRTNEPALFTRLLKWKHVRGEASWLSVGANGTVLTIDPEYNVWRWNGGNSWGALAGQFRRVAVSGTGAIWGIDLQNRVFRNATGQWIDAGIVAAEIAVGAKEEAWAIGLDGGLGRFDPQSRQWVAVPGGPARAIAVGKDGDAWIIDNAGMVHHLIESASFPGIVAVSLGVGPEGTVYATTAKQELFWLDKLERQWKPATGIASAVAVGPAGTPWIIGERNELMVSTAFIAEHDAIVEAQAAQTTKRPAVFTVLPPAASSLPTLSKPLVYSTIAGTYVDIGVGADGSVFAAGNDGGLYCFSDPDQRFLLASSGAVRRVAVSPSGVPWVISSAGQVSFFGSNSWVSVPDFRADDIAFGQDGVAYATGQNAVYSYVPASQNFQQITTYTSGVPLSARRVAFAQNALWGITANNQLLKCSVAQCQVESISAIDIGSGPDGTLMVLDMNGALQRLNPRTGSFNVVNGTGVALSVGPQGLPWLVSKAGSINSSGLFGVNSKTVNTSNCAQRFAGNAVPTTPQPTVQLTALDNALTLNPGATASLLANVRLNGTIPAPSSVTVAFSSANAQLIQANGNITVSSNALPGTTLTGAYTVCALPGAVPCSSARVSVLVGGSTAVAVADSATVNPGSTLNLLANDLLNGVTPAAGQVTVTFNSADPALTQSGGLVTLATGTLPGSIHNATYKFCAFAGTVCSGTVNVTIVAPVTVPGSPMAVSAIAGNAQATVSFTAPAANGGSAVTGYTVTSSPGGLIARGSASPITVSGLANGTAYTFTVAATNAAGTGPASSPSSAVTPVTVPGSPTAVSATAGNAQAAVSFTAPAANGGSAITGYTVTSSPGGITASGSASPITVSGLANGTAYTFTVAAISAAGTGPASPASSAVTPVTVPGSPTAVSAIAGNAQASVSFTAPASNGGSAVTGYTVTSSPGGIAARGSTSPITVSGLANGTAYTFTVAATSAAGTGPASSPSSAVTPVTVPGSPTAVSATAGNAQAAVSFTAPAANGGSAITGYTVTSSPGGLIASGSASPITVSGLANGTAYTFTVAATNAAGTGPASSPSGAVTPVTVPGSPTAVSAIAGNAQATVSFTAPAANGGSAITGYTVTSSPGGITASGSASPITVSGLANGTAYTFTVAATSAVGTGAVSAATNSVTPLQLPDAPVISNVTSPIRYVSPNFVVSFSLACTTTCTPITNYTVTATEMLPPGQTFTATGTSSPITIVTDAAYVSSQGIFTFTVTATNATGTGPASSPVNY